MTASFEDIEGKYDLVFGFIQRDLERFLAQDVGGNFAVAPLQPAPMRRSLSLWKRERR